MTSIMVTIMIDTDDGCRSGCMSRSCAADEADTDGTGRYVTMMTKTSMTTVAQMKTEIHSSLPVYTC